MTTQIPQNMLGPNVSSNGPAFSAYQSTATSIPTSAVATKMNFQTVEYDTNNNYNTSTSRFQPTVPGYYTLKTSVQVPSGNTRGSAAIYKNGALWKWLADNGTIYTVGGSVDLYLNGTTDYVEVYVLVYATGNTGASQAYTWFQGSLTRAA